MLFQSIFEFTGQSKNLIQGPQCESMEIITQLMINLSLRKWKSQPLLLQGRLLESASMEQKHSQSGAGMW